MDMRAKTSAAMVLDLCEATDALAAVPTNVEAFAARKRYLRCRGHCEREMNRWRKMLVDVDAQMHALAKKRLRIEKDCVDMAVLMRDMAGRKRKRAVYEEADLTDEEDFVSSPIPHQQPYQPPSTTATVDEQVRAPNCESTSRERITSYFN